MFLVHVIDFHLGQLTIFKSLFKCLAGMVRMYMNLNHFLIGNAYDGIADRLKKCLEFSLLVLCKLFLKKDDKLCTIAILDISGRNILGINALLSAALSRNGSLSDKYYFLTAQSLKSALHDF